MNQTLDAVRQASEALLAEGAADPGSVWRNPTLVTIGAGQVPRARTVVLRRFDAGQRLVEIHADARSAKIAELAAQPLAGLHGWDAGRQVQLRLTGCVTLHTEGPVADAAWTALRPQSRATYEVQPGPGTVLASPEQIGGGDDPRAAFCVLLMVYHTLEYLGLAKAGHRRARFGWAVDGARSEWVVP